MLPNVDKLIVKGSQGQVVGTIGQLIHNYEQQQRLIPDIKALSKEI